MSRYYAPTHEWFDFYPERKVVRIGVTYRYPILSEDITHIEFPSVGKVFEIMDSVCVIKSENHASDVRTPVAGKITAFNTEVKPETIDNDPDNTWLFEITFTKEPSGLLTLKQYHERIFITALTADDQGQNSINSSPTEIYVIREALSGNT